ncbi:MAG: helix-turn-helix transcriptional regulator [Verrucomicrobiota bacterium]
MTNTRQFSDTVKSVREKLGISQEDLARELGISFSTVNRWENGKTTPSRLAQKSFDTFCIGMKKEGKL